jgi:hypothetical protein
VAVAWKSPVASRVRITGRLADADPAGGDGIAWIVDLRTANGRQELATGDFPNGGAQKLTDGKNAERLSSVEVKEGDSLELLVLPKENYICDTTVVELTIAEAEGTAEWNLTRDLVDDPHQGNPHADRLGHPAVWHFYDMAESNRARQAPTAFNPALAVWMQTAREKQDRALLQRAAEDFQKTFEVVDDRSPFWIHDPADQKYWSPSAREELATLTGALATLKKTPPPPEPFANGAQEGGVPDSPQAGIHDVRVHIRGRYDRLGDVVPRRFPLILAGDDQTPIARGSGRLQLARWLASADNPLTARVIVNRIWQYHFGEGIARTPSNFGKLGERPSHPELLDYLARSFVESSWSIKALHRDILLSAAYQQSSAPPPESLAADPDNRLIGRMNRRRLEAEAIRDTLLAVAGNLDLEQAGPAVRDFSSPRRSLYQMTVRSDRAGFGPLFDVADSTALVDKRTVSTVAPQALFLLNHPFVVAQTAALTQRILSGSATGERERIERAYLVLYGRLPTEEEYAVGESFLRRSGERGDKPEICWQAYCQVLLCANELIYLD